MYVCCCNGITDRQIKQSVETNEIQTLRELNNKFGMGKQCGKCVKEVRQIFNESLAEQKRTNSKLINPIAVLA